jgi:hypothetical protein
MCVSQDLECIWPDEMYVHGVCDHIRLSGVLCMSGMQVCIEYVDILILDTTTMVLYQYTKNVGSFESFSS